MNTAKTKVVQDLTGLWSRFFCMPSMVFSLNGMSVGLKQVKMVILLNVGKHYLLLQEVLSAHKTLVESSACTGNMKPLSDLAPAGAKRHSWLGSCFFPIVCGLGSASCPAVQ